MGYNSRVSTIATYLTPQRRARKEAGLSLRQLEAATHINRGILSLYENGRMLPTQEQLAKIDRAIEEAKASRIA